MTCNHFLRIAPGVCDVWEVAVGARMSSPPPYPKSVLCITGVTCNHFLRIAPGVCDVWEVAVGARGAASHV